MAEILFEFACIYKLGVMNLLRVECGLESAEECLLIVVSYRGHL